MKHMTEELANRWMRTIPCTIGVTGLGVYNTYLSMSHYVQGESVILNLFVVASCLVAAKSLQVKRQSIYREFMETAEDIDA